MNYSLIKDVITLVQEFEAENSTVSGTGHHIADFKNWIISNQAKNHISKEPHWEGKENGRSPESVINTLLVHMNRYAKNYSKSAIFGSTFSSQEDFIYLINLKAFGKMTKMDLIKKNVHDKPAGILIINRLITQGWVKQTTSEIDKRNKFIQITPQGIQSLDSQMAKIRAATMIVTGDLSHPEKMELIRLLQKLNDYHRPIYDQHIEPKNLLQTLLNSKK